MAESQQLKLAVKGLFTHPNNLSEVPEGALAIANNVVIDREGIVESRRGQKQYHYNGSNIDTTGAKTLGLFEYQDKMYKYAADGYLYYDGGLDPWNTIGTGIYGPTANNGIIRTTKASKNLYFTTTRGIYKSDLASAAPKSAGGIKALGGVGAVSGATGFMTNNTNVAYRMVWGYKDLNLNLILGSPSERLVVSNASGGTRDISLTYAIPTGITTNHFYQVYRSGESSGLADEPNDEMYLVYEDNPTSGQITAKSFTITDNTPNDLKGATLYTSPSQEGIANSNEEPPFANDITLYKNHVLFANTQRKEQATITLISVGGTAGVQVNDTITISTIVYTGKAAENIALNEFQVYTAGTPAENIEATSLSLVRVINQSATNTKVYAYYISGFNDLPGKILIEARTYTDTISVASSRGGAFNPTLTTALLGDKEIAQNRVYVSKLQQPESVPLYRYLDVGTSDEPIRRIVGLRDSVIIFKDDGIFRISGETFQNFVVTLLDGTSRLVATESVAPFNNQVVCFTDQGIVAVSESQVQVLSRAIESTLLELSSQIYDPLFHNATFAVGYESARKYILYTITDATSTGADQAFVYNAATNSWTVWKTTVGQVYQSALVAKRDDFLYQVEVIYNTGLSKWINTVTQERKTFTTNDYADKEYGITITSVISETELAYNTVTSSIPSPSIGWGIKQSTRTSTVSSVTVLTPTTGTIKLSHGYTTWTTGVATEYEPITTKIRTVPIHGTNPGIQKQFREITFFFANASFNSMDCIIRNPIAGIEQLVPLYPLKGGLWGLFSWGTRDWGGGYGGQQPLRMLIPPTVTRSHWIDIGLGDSEAFTSFSLGGMSLIFTTMSSRSK